AVLAAVRRHRRPVAGGDLIHVELGPRPPEPRLEQVPDLVDKGARAGNAGLGAAGGGEQDEGVAVAGAGTVGDGAIAEHPGEAAVGLAVMFGEEPQAVRGGIALAILA